jgi:hypothetical protein
MKSFTEYLTESKKVYEFKIKLAGDFEKGAAAIKKALAQYKIESCSTGKRTPIAETQPDFPSYKNINVTVFEVKLCYPATSPRVRAAVAEALACSEDCVKVRNLHEQAEDEINHANDTKADGAVLTKDYEATDNQKIVGDKHVFSLLKELGKMKNSGEQVKGTNDAILAKSVPSEKTAGAKK